MKNKIIFFISGLFMAIILISTQASAYSYLGCDKLHNYGDDKEKEFLNELLDSKGLEPVDSVLKLYEPSSNFDWNTKFDYTGPYIMFKIGTGSSADCEIFAFDIRDREGESWLTYGDVIDALFPLIGSDTSYTREEFRNRTSHASGSVPIPAAAWLMGSGLVGLMGLRRKFSRKP